MEIRGMEHPLSFVELIEKTIGGFGEVMRLGLEGKPSIVEVLVFHEVEDKLTFADMEENGENLAVSVFDGCLVRKSWVF